MEADFLHALKENLKEVAAIATAITALIATIAVMSETIRAMSNPTIAVVIAIAILVIAIVIAVARPRNPHGGDAPPAEAEPPAPEPAPAPRTPNGSWPHQVLPPAPDLRTDRVVDRPAGWCIGHTPTGNEWQRERVIDSAPARPEPAVANRGWWRDHAAAVDSERGVELEHESRSS